MLPKRPHLTRCRYLVTRWSTCTLWSGCLGTAVRQRPSTWPPPRGPPPRPPLASPSEPSPPCHRDRCYRHQHRGPGRRHSPSPGCRCWLPHRVHSELRRRSRRPKWSFMRGRRGVLAQRQRDRRRELRGQRYQRHRLQQHQGQFVSWQRLVCWRARALFCHPQQQP